MSDDKKVPKAAEKINLEVWREDNVKVKFRMKKTTPIRKLLRAFCNHLGFGPRAFSFLHNGIPFDESETPLALGMEEDDLIFAHFTQVGHCSQCTDQYYSSQRANYISQRVNYRSRRVNYRSRRVLPRKFPPLSGA